MIQNQAGQYLIHFIHLVLITKSESHVVPTSSAARQLVEPIFNSLMSLGDGGTASCKLGKAQVGSGVVGGGCHTWVGSWWERLQCKCAQQAALNMQLQWLVAIRAMSSGVFKAESRCIRTLLVWGKEQTDSLLVVLVVCWVRLTTVHHSSIPWVSAVIREDLSWRHQNQQQDLKIFLSKPTSYTPLFFDKNVQHDVPALYRG